MLRQLIVLALLASASSAFSIDSYFNHAAVLPDGSLHVYEDINFTLEKQYEQGFRTIRPADAPSPDSVTLEYVKVDGQEVAGYVDTYNGDTEIVWNVTHEGPNEVELSYILSNMTTVWDDYARVCYEHYGANWPVSASVLRTQMDLPAGSEGRTVHFQIYSREQGNASIEGLSVVAELQDVPSGNYVGGCYLFPKDTVNTTNVMSGSAFQILQDERASYGSTTIIAPDPPTPLGYVCIPLTALMVLAAAAGLFHRTARRLEESILPPSDEQPAVVTAILKNDIPEKDLLAATLLGLINKGAIDIIELERKGEASATIERPRSVLTLRKEDGLLPHEKALVDMVFAGKKEAELDERAKALDSITTQTEAKESEMADAMEKFRKEEKALADAKGDWLKNPASNRFALVATLGVFALVIAFFVFVFAMTEYDSYAYYGQMQLLWILVASLPVALVAYAVIAYEYSRPKVLKGHETEYAQWDAFARAVKSSRLKTYPPGSVVIWGDILVYATALGLAGRVSRHFSQLDSLTLKRLQQMDSVRLSSYSFYTSSLAASNLATYGDRAGNVSSGSSGGWSSGGGGGFSSGSSGGGGFR